MEAMDAWFRIKVIEEVAGAIIFVIVLIAILIWMLSDKLPRTKKKKRK